jgi:hypothetical protein
LIAFSRLAQCVDGCSEVHKSLHLEDALIFVVLMGFALCLSAGDCMQSKQHCLVFNFVEAFVYSILSMLSRVVCV